MPIAPRTDKVREVLNSFTIDLGCFVETWLQDHIPDQIISAAAYNLIRRGRHVEQHGGDSAYIRSRNLQIIVP